MDAPYPSVTAPEVSERLDQMVNYHSLGLSLIFYLFNNAFSTA
jgi:hypothetical protein